MCGDAWLLSILLNNVLHVYQHKMYGQLVMLPMFEITSFRVVEKYTTHISLKKHLTSIKRCFMRTNQQNPIYTIWNITYIKEKDKSVDLIAPFHISNGLATFFIFR